MAAFPVEILLGVYLGLLTGILPALISGGLGFAFRYFTGVTLPGLGVVVLAVAIAGVNGGLLGLVDPTITASPRLLVATIVVMMLALYAHSQGDKLGASLPRRFSLRDLRRRTLSTDVVEFVGGRNRVTIQPIGPVADIEGYPPLPGDLRAKLAAGSWELPADLPIEDLESRLEERLRSEYDLAEVTASIDTRGRARISAAPPTGGLSRRVPRGQRAVSIETLLPSGMAEGEKVSVETPLAIVEGTVVSAGTGGEKSPPTPAQTTNAAETDGGTDDTAELTPTSAPTTDGGEGRLTVAVPKPEAQALLRADRGRVVVRPRGTRREFELLSVFRRAGKVIGKVSVRPDGPLDGTTLGGAGVREAYGVAVLAVRRSAGGDREWVFSPSGSTTVSANDELFVVSSRDALSRFREVIG